MRKIILILVLLTLPIVMSSAVEVNQMAYTRITEINIKPERELLDRDTCYDYFGTNTECRRVDFTVVYEIWNPERDDFTFTTDDSRMVDLLYEIELAEKGIQVAIEDSSPVEAVETKHSISSGVCSDSITLSIIMEHDCYYLVDGVYTIAVELSTEAVGQINYIGEINVENGIKTYSLAEPTEWPECETQSSPFGFMALIAAMTTLVLFKRRRE